MTKINCIKLLLTLVTFVGNALAVPASQPIQIVSVAANQFAADIYHQIRESTGNICVCPYGLSSALSMSACGAGGATAGQMYQVLHWNGTPTDLSMASAALIKAMEVEKSAPNQPQSQISIANALFAQHGLSFENKFLDQLKNHYGAALQQVNFADAPAEACKQVNQWAAQKTNDRIKQALDPGEATAATRLILVDAVYFKANWENAFSKAATQNKPFTTDANKTISVPMMQQMHSFDYFANETTQIAALPYMGDFEMDIVLPRAKDGISAVEKILTGDRLSSFFEKLTPQLLDLSLPKFKFEGKFELKDSLEKLGMKDAFDPQKADFSGITSSDKLNIDNVFQRTFISLDEDGTEAAAVTSITMRSMAMRGGAMPEKVIFLADHPFLFIIRHRPTGTILFMGRITNPK